MVLTQFVLSWILLQYFRHLFWIFSRLIHSCFLLQYFRHPFYLLEYFSLRKSSDDCRRRSKGEAKDYRRKMTRFQRLFPATQSNKNNDSTQSIIYTSTSTTTNQMGIMNSSSLSFNRTMAIISGSGKSNDMVACNLYNQDLSDRTLVAFSRRIVIYSNN